MVLYRIFFLCFGLGMCVGCTEACTASRNPCQEPNQPYGTESVRLSPRFRPGQTYAQKVHFTSDMRMRFPWADYQDCEMILRYQVDQVNAEGVAQVTVTVDSVKASMRSLSIFCKYDSQATPSNEKAKRPAGKPSRQEQYTRSFEGIRGCKFSAQVDAQGRVLKFLEMDNKIRRLVSGPVTSANFGGNQLALVFSETNLREYVSLWLYGFLAGAAPQVNTTWVGYMPVETPQTAPVLGLKNYTLKRVEEKEGETIATFELATKGPVSKPALPEYVAANLKKRNPGMEAVKVEHGSGQAVLSLSGGHPIKFYEKIIVEVQLAGKKNQKLASNKENAQKTFYFTEKTIEYIPKP